MLVQLHGAFIISQLTKAAVVLVVFCCWFVVVVIVVVVVVVVVFTVVVLAVGFAIVHVMFVLVINAVIVVGLVLVLILVLVVVTAWHLAWVRVTHLTTKDTALFPADRWIGLEPLAPRATDSISWVKLPTQLNMPQAQPQAAAATAMIGATGHDSKLQFAETTTTSSSSNDSSSRGSLQRTLGVATKPLVQPGYQVTFYTSNIWAAGTDAKVYFDLTGQDGSSGKGLC
jgi:hypothetical protein